MGRNLVLNHRFQFLESDLDTLGKRVCCVSRYRVFLEELVRAGTGWRFWSQADRSFEEKRCFGYPVRSRHVGLGEGKQIEGFGDFLLITAIRLQLSVQQLMFILLRNTRVAV